MDFHGYYGKHKRKTEPVRQGPIVNSKEDVLSLCPNSTTDKMPNNSGIYFITDGSEIYYVGKSINLAKRGRVYKHYSQINANIVVRYILCGIELIDNEELRLIELLKPKLNVPRPQKDYRKDNRLSCRLSQDTWNEIDEFKKDSGIKELSKVIETLLSDSLLDYKISKQKYELSDI